MPTLSVRPVLVRRFVALTATITLAVGLPAGASTPAFAVTEAKLVTKINQVMEDPRVQRAKSGVVVLDGVSGDLLYSRYGARSVVPASNTKIVTAVAAMHTLGPKFRFKTEVFRRAEIVRGTLRGRLYLKGYGDPTTRQSDFASLAAQIKKKGVTVVTGPLIVDAGYFDSQRYNPGWSTSYAARYYAAEISALTLAPNADLDSGTVIISYAPGRRGKPAKITTTPAAAARYLTFANSTTTSARGTATTFAARRSPGSNTIRVSGRVPSGRSTGHWQITVHRPELYAAAVFRAELGKVGIKVQGPTRLGSTPGTSRHRLGVDTSMQLFELLVPFLKLSNNMHAEALTKQMGTMRGRRGNWKDGLSLTRAYLEQLGVPMAGVSLTDGSGLTRRNTLTPLALATVLQRVQTQSWFEQFRASLPLAGNPSRMTGGTLRQRMTGTRAANNARAKTGTLTGVTALSGYVRGRDDHLYVFSMISNYRGSTPRPVENTLVVNLAGWRRSQ